LISIVYSKTLISVAIGDGASVSFASLGWKSGRELGVESCLLKSSCVGEWCRSGPCRDSLASSCDEGVVVVIVLELSYFKILPVSGWRGLSFPVWPPALSALVWSRPFTMPITSSLVHRDGRLLVPWNAQSSRSEISAIGSPASSQLRLLSSGQASP